MGNQESTFREKTQSIEIKKFITSSPVTGSPLLDENSINVHGSWYERRIELKRSTTKYTQPVGEASFRNSSRIVTGKQAGNGSVAIMITWGLALSYYR
jgi:hypothetical protein